MAVWLIEPRDPLIFRDGRPFNPTPGARAESLPFPYPSTLAGAVRTRAGQDEKGVFDKRRVDELMQACIRGPVLAGADPHESWYFPAPADCLVIRPEGEQDRTIGQRLWARPVDAAAGESTNLPDDLQPVSICPVRKDKGHAGAPRFWKWTALEKWLIAPADDSTPMNLEHLGIPGLTTESRVHVKFDPDDQTAEEGMLFETSGLEFARVEDKRKLSNARQYALAVETEAGLREGVDFLGGERRMVNWRKGSTLPDCPQALGDAIQRTSHCRLLLATPALFDKGYLPTWVETCTPGVTVQVAAAAVPRYQAVSGWDYKKKYEKASRRLAPAGSVYFLKLAGDEGAIGQFVKRVWMQNISDDEQDRRDGFGLALLGTWDGKIEPLRLEDH